MQQCRNLGIFSYSHRSNSILITNPFMIFSEFLCCKNKEKFEVREKELKLCRIAPVPKCGLLLEEQGGEAYKIIKVFLSLECILMARMPGCT